MDEAGAPGAASIPLDQIRLPRGAQLGEAEMEQLVASVRRHGLLPPIVVRPLAKRERERSGRAFRVLVGAHRLLAAARAGLLEVDCLVDGSTPEAALAAALADPIHQRALARDEEHELLRYLRGDCGMELRDVARVLGRSVPYVSRRLSVAASRPLSTAVRAGRLAPSLAQELVATPPEWWPVLVEHAPRVARSRLRAVLAGAQRLGVDAEGLRRLLAEAGASGASPAAELLRSVEEWSARLPPDWRPNAEERAMLQLVRALAAAPAGRVARRAKAS